MATTSIFAVCKSCDSKYRIRYGRGDNFPQKATFDCETCSATIEVGVTRYQAPLELKNATLIPPDQVPDGSVYKVMNIHAELPIDPGQEHNPHYFATLSSLERMLDRPSKILQLRRVQMASIDFAAEWGGINVLLKLISNDRISDAENLANQNIEEIYSRFSDWIAGFLIGSQTEHLNAAIAELTKSRSASSFLRFKEYLKSNLSEFTSNLWSGASIYMNSRPNFDKTIYYQKLNDEVPDSAKARSNWDEMRTVYGDLYESVGNLMYVPACINNMNSNRLFDEFSSPKFDLTKYRSTDKAGRCENFGNNGSFAFIVKSYHAWIRNGTHHQKVKFRPHTEKLEFKIGKGGINDKEITLIDYIKYTNDLFSSLLVISYVYFKAISK